MNELHFDLIRRYPRNIFRIAMGALLLAAVAYFIVRQETFFSTTHLVVFTLAGLYYLLMGLGINPFTIWAKAYIKVNRDRIQVKPSMFSKVKNIEWAAISEVQIKVMGIRFLSETDEAYEFSFQKLDEENIQELKHAIIALSKEKGIKLA